MRYPKIASMLRRGRLRTAVLALAAVSAFAVLACSSDDDPAVVATTVPTTAPAPTAASEPTEAPAVVDTPAMSVPTGSGDAGDLVIALGELNGSGQTGIATLTAMGDQTEVVISIVSGAAGVPQPIHVHSGTCDTLGGVDYPLTAVVDGSSELVAK